MILRLGDAISSKTRLATRGFHTMWFQTGSMAKSTPKRSAASSTGSIPRRKD